MPGELIKNLQGQWTFVPAPLPGRLQWTNSLVKTLADASAVLGQLQSMTHWKFLDPRRLLRLFLRREAELSSRIENTYARVQTLLLYEKLPAIEEKAPDVREVENNFKALEYGLAAVEHRPISLGLIKEMHQILLQGVRGDDHTPGQFRQVQAHIGRSNKIEEARFVPPPHHEVEPSMRELERYIQQPDDLPALVRLAMVHYQFEAIHPFSDGNGRIGRVLILMLMSTEGVLRTPLLNPSAPLERQRREYYDHLLAVSQRGAWSEWVEFVIRGIADEALATIDRIQRLEVLRQRYLDQLSAVRASPLAAKLVDRLFAEPSVTLQQVAEVLQTSKPSAQKLIDRFMGAGILRETTGQQRNRVYLAQEIVDQLS
ncbi:MAG: Fic family protein [Tepidisphaeraceae bacterium]